MHTYSFECRLGLPARLGHALLALALALVFLPAPARADDAGTTEVSVDTFRNRDGFAAVLYDNQSGLPTSEANAIAETAEGFIWIGSYSGLIRYDGHTFERIDSTSGVASVVSLFVDSRNRLWIGTNDSGMAVMEHGEFTFFTKADGLGSSSVHAISEDAAGNIYAATTSGVSVVTTEGAVRSLDDSRLSGAYVSDLRAGAGGLLYGLTRDGSVFLLDEGRVIAYHTADDIGVNDVNEILPDLENPGLAYFGTKGSAVLHGTLSNLREAEVIDISPLSHVKSVEHYGDDLWICADNGIGAVRDGKLQVLEDVPLTNSVDHSMVDYQGNLWFTSSRQGVMKVVPNQFLDLTERWGLDECVVNTTCRLGDVLLMGTDDGLVATDDSGKAAKIALSEARTASGERLAATDLTSMLDTVRIRSIVRDREGRVWLSTFGEMGLIRFDGKVATCFTQADGMPSDRVRTVVELADGSFAAACTGGVAIIEADKVTRVLAADDGIANLEVLSVCEAPDGRLLVGTDGGGMYVVGKDEVKHIGVDEGLSSDVVLRIKRDISRDLVWIITSNALAYLDADLHVSVVRRFPYSNNFDLYENGSDEMWVLSSNGIYVAQVAQLLANKAIDVVYYGSESGLTRIATANSYSELTEDGDLYIAGTTGVVRVNIEVPYEDVGEMRMAVPYVSADGELVYPDEQGEITIPSHTSRLIVYPHVFTYSLMDPQVTYSLTGFEDRATTVRASELAEVDYTNLAGGTYAFHMRLSDAMGHGNQELSVRIVKELALTEQMWFRVAALALVGVGIWGIAQLVAKHRTQLLLRKQEEDRLYIREMSEAFAHIIDMKDKYTSGHSSRVAKYTRYLTRELGCDEDTVERYYNIALLHDIGKIGIPTEVLNKPGRLTDEEFAQIKSHTTLGYEALKGISIMPEIATGAWLHHERPDGRGYPQGLSGDDIPRVARIIAVADCFDAMYSDRPYRKRMNFDKAVSIIKEVRGTQLDADVVDAFLKLVERGEFRNPNDLGGGSFEDIDNIHRRYEET